MTNIVAITAIQRVENGKIVTVKPGGVFDASQAEIDDLDRVSDPQRPCYRLATDVDEATSRTLASQGVKLVTEVPRLPMKRKDGTVAVPEPVAAVGLSDGDPEPDQEEQKGPRKRRTKAEMEAARAAEAAAAQLLG